MSGRYIVTVEAVSQASWTLGTTVGALAGTGLTALVGDDIKLLGENESIYIPLGATHSLENPGKIPLDLIEVRSGSYLEEDDVVRFADRYGRV